MIVCGVLLLLQLQSNNGDTCYDLDGLDDDVTDLTNALEGAGLGEDAGGWTSEESIIVSPCIKLIQVLFCVRLLNEGLRTRVAYSVSHQSVWNCLKCTKMD